MLANNYHNLMSNSLSLSYTDKPGSENSASSNLFAFGEPAEFLLPGEFWRSFDFRSNRLWLIGFLFS